MLDRQRQLHPFATARRKLFERQPCRASEFVEPERRSVELARKPAVEGNLNPMRITVRRKRDRHHSPRRLIWTPRNPIQRDRDRRPGQHPTQLGQRATSLHCVDPQRDRNRDDVGRTPQDPLLNPISVPDPRTGIQDHHRPITDQRRQAAARPAQPRPAGAVPASAAPASSAAPPPSGARYAASSAGPPTPPASTASTTSTRVKARSGSRPRACKPAVPPVRSRSTTNVDHRKDANVCARPSANVVLPLPPLGEHTTNTRSLGIANPDSSAKRRSAAASRRSISLCHNRRSDPITPTPRAAVPIHLLRKQQQPRIHHLAATGPLVRGHLPAPVGHSDVSGPARGACPPPPACRAAACRGAGWRAFVRKRTDGHLDRGVGSAGTPAVARQGTRTVFEHILACRHEHPG